MPRDTIDHDRLDITLDQRPYICDELVIDAGAFLIDPFSGDQLLVVSDLMDILDFGSCLLRIVRSPDDDCHQSALSFVRCLHSRAADLISFEDVDPGNEVARCSLQG